MRKFGLIPVLAALSIVLLPAQAAQAAAPEVQDHYDDVFDILAPTSEDPPGSTFCGLLDVPIHGELHGYFSIQTRGNSDFPYFADRFRQLFVYTNPDTGKTFTVDTVGTAKDLHVVDNGDGTLTLTNMVAGVQKVYDSNGDLLFMDRGLFRETVLIDYNGTIDPDDDVFIESITGPQFFGPHETADRDFCEDFLEFTA